MDAIQLPDLTGWLYVEVWTLEETAMLWAAIDPADYDGMLLRDLSQKIPREQYKKAWMSLRAVSEAVCSGTLAFTEAWEWFDGASEPVKVEFPDVPAPDRLIQHMTRIRQSAFLQWAKEKRLPSYRQQVTRARAFTQRQSPTLDGPEVCIDAPSTSSTQLLLPSPTFLDPDNPLSPTELRACVEAWQIVVDGGLHERNRTPKQAIRDVLDSLPQFADLSTEAKTRISMVANWNRAGGPQKAPGN